MRVLMLESHPGVGRDALHALACAGHTIVRCDTADRRYPCRGLAADGDCPLDDHVDVAVLAQEIGTDHVEHGALCAARSRVPIVEISRAHATPHLPTTILTSTVGRDLLDECERASRDGRAHVRAVTDRLLALGVLEQAELADGTVAIAIERGTNRLLMTIELNDSALPRRTEIVRAATEALRRFDRRQAVIDIAVRGTDLLAE